MGRPVVYECGKSKLSSFFSRRGRESMIEDLYSHSEILSPICLENQCDDDDDLLCGKFFKDKMEMNTKLRLHAVSQSFEFHTEYSDRTRYILSCVDEKCSWSFRAKSVKGSQSVIGVRMSCYRGIPITLQRRSPEYRSHG